MFFFYHLESNYCKRKDEDHYSKGDLQGYLICGLAGAYQNYETSLKNEPYFIYSKPENKPFGGSLFTSERVFVMVSVSFAIFFQLSCKFPL